VREQQALPLRDTAQPIAAPRLRVRPRHLAVTSITILSAVLNVAGLQDESYANTYYAAAVKSMLLSWHNFFFVSFDPGGFVAVDKPPLGLWLQVVSAKLFGYSGVSMLLPQAIAGILAVLLLYHLVARVFGTPAGLLAALSLAVTPIAVVDSRNNTPDSVLVLLVLLAVWAVLRAVEAGSSDSRRGGLRWLLLSAIFVGLAFNVKELEAYLVVPALALVYAVGARCGWLRRVWHLLLAGPVLLVLSFAWIIAVDLTPASQRPYVSDSGSNSELSLALGYNGFGRLAAGIASHIQIPFLHIHLDFSIVPAISFEIGNPGFLRLVQPQVGGQASWLLPLAFIGLIAAASQLRGRITVRRELLNLLLWGTLLATLAVFFSVARFYHLYYLTILGAPVAALAGIGAVALWRDYRQALAGGHWWQGWALPLALPLTALAQANILAGYSTWNAWLGPALIAAGVAAALILIAGRLHVQVLLSPEVLLRLNAQVLFAASALGVLSLLAAPTAFAAISVADGNGAGWLIQAGPPANTNGFGGRFGLTGRSPGLFSFGGSGGPGQSRRGRFGFPGAGSGSR
jgi:4-amino-4-deoxy-L-arabinose transferase-like glycosyltransferase